MFDDRQNGDAGKIGQKMFELDDAILQFAVAGGFGKIFQLERLFEGKFADGGATDFGEVRARAKLLAHFVRQRANVGAGRALDDKASDVAFDCR